MSYPFSHALEAHLAGDPGIRASMPRRAHANNSPRAPAGLRIRTLDAQATGVGRHFPDLLGDPVPTHGYYFAPRHHKLARLRPGDRLPRHMGPWEFVARDDEGTSSEILQRLIERHPNLDPYRLTYATSTPVDPLHLAKTRRARMAGYALVFGITFALSLLALGGLRERRRPHEGVTVFPRARQRG